MPSRLLRDGTVGQPLKQSHSEESRNVRGLLEKQENDVKMVLGKNSIKPFDTRPVIHADFPISRF